MGTGEGRGEALAGLFCGSVHTLALAPVRREGGTEPASFSIAFQAPVAHPGLLFLGGRKPGNRKKATRLQAAGQIPPSAMHSFSCWKERRVVTSKMDFCTSHWAGMAAEIHVEVNIKLFRRYYVTSQSLSSAPTCRTAGGTVMPTQERCPHRSTTWHCRAGAVAPACSLRDNKLSLGSCFFLKHSGFPVLAVSVPGQQGCGPAAG